MIEFTLMWTKIKCHPMWEWKVKTENKFNYRKIKLYFSYTHLGYTSLVGLDESVHPPPRPQNTLGKALKKSKVS